MEATPRIELGIKVLQTSALPLGYVALKGGAENEIRTRDPLLGKEVLYHWAISALATRMGLEPTTSAVTGRHSNQLNHRANVSVSDSYIYYHTFCVLARGFFEKILEKVFQRQYRYALSLDASSRTSASESLEWRTVNSMLMPSARRPLANSIFFSLAATSQIT